MLKCMGWYLILVIFTKVRQVSTDKLNDILSALDQGSTAREAAKDVV